MSTQSKNPPSMIALAIAATLVLSGCGVVRSITGVNTLHLRDAQVMAMEAEIDFGAKTICPRRPVQMHVAVSAQLPGQPQSSTYDTWRGTPGVRRNGKLDFANFVFTSEQGQFDEWGWFYPNPDVLATLDSGFTIATQLQHPSAQLAAQKHYQPEYSCIVSAGVPGAPGRSGNDGSSGSSGSSGSDGSEGGNGSEGGWGGDGGPGGDGYQGPHLQVYATYVSTRLYPKLLAVRVSGDRRDFALAPADQPLALIARGGQGGRGGSGGAGGSGGRGGSGKSDNSNSNGDDQQKTGGRGGNGGNGGSGGSGGPGGIGGDGGEIELMYDARYPELAQLLLFDVDGGLPGEGGTSGSSGSGGGGGSGGYGSGGTGSSGNSGNYGTYGTAGRAQASAGDVSQYFRSIPGIKLLADTSSSSKPSSGKPAIKQQPSKPSSNKPQTSKQPSRK